MKIITNAALVSILFAANAFAQTFGPLVEPAELASQRSSVNPVILDIRKGYEEGHIPGAVSAPYGLFRGTSENPGKLFDIAKLEADLERIGLSQNDTIVVVADGKTSTDFGAAARVYWTLKSTGFTDLTILNGGHAAWVAAGLDIDDTRKRREPTELSLVFNETWFAGTEDIKSVVSGPETAILVDSRSEPFYVGDKAHPAAAKPGTLPGAINHAFTTFFDGDTPAIKPAIDGATLRASLDITQGEDIISFCNTGHWAASHWFAVSELAGLDNARLYAGSMVEYSNADLPMENTPGLLKNLLKKVIN
jgi:thiosulfate/3-mercaptopyruvate sulfurtransferase